MTDPQHRQRRGRRRWLWLIASLTVLNLVVFGAYAYARNLHSIVVDEVTMVPEVDDALDPAPDAASDPMTFLVIGSDSREGLPEDWTDDFGAFGGERADVVMLVQALPEQGRVQMLSIPRDLRVEIPGHGADKINAAFAYGGAELMVETVRANFDLPVHHYVEVDFSGFAAIVDEVGGVTLTFDHPARDLKSGLSVDAGTQQLDGRQALAYARSRSYQEFQDGSWVFVDANDFGRTERQQEIVVAILSELAGPGIVLEAPGVVSALAQHMTVDSAFVDIPFGEVAWHYRTFTSSAVDQATIPAEGRSIDDVYFAIAVQPETDRLLGAFRSGGSLELAAGDEPLAVEVLNANGTDGLAGAWGDWLIERGFVVEHLGDAPTAEVTVVLASEGEEAKATQLVDLLDFGTAEAGSQRSGVDLTLVLGEDADFPEG